MKEFGISVCLLLSVDVIVLGTTYSCKQSNDAYYTSMRDCISKGGNFIPTRSNNGNDALCLMNK